MNPRLIDIERARELLSYDSETGNLIRRQDALSGQHKSFAIAKAGDVAGCLRKDGYVVISIDGVVYLAHRLVWAVVKGCQPPRIIDHIDGNPSNNKIDNLRAADHKVNGLNQRKPKGGKSSSGVLGVRRVNNTKSERWQAMLQFDGTQLFLGNFERKEDAEAAYNNAKALIMEAALKLVEPSTRTEEESSLDSSPPA